MPQADVLTLNSLLQRNASTISPNEYEFLELNSQDEKYVTISKQLKASMKHFKVVRIEQTWNQRLWEGFDEKKKKMENKTEMLLFQTACCTHVDYCCKKNFKSIPHGNWETRSGKGNFFVIETNHLSLQELFIWNLKHCYVCIPSPGWKCHWRKHDIQ